MKVFKFGGASVRDENAIRNLSEIIRRQREADRLVLVISALGKTTNALEAVVDDFYHGRSEATAKLRAIKDEHLSIAEKLGLIDLLESGALTDTFVEAEWLIEDEIEDSYDYIYDQIVAIGELLSTRLIHAYLNSIGMGARWIDARDMIKTDDSYRSGTIDWERTTEKVHQFLDPCLERGDLIVTAGFIGSTLENNTITLGREGSDYTGAIIAAILGAESLTVWKDVPGIMNADPHLFPDADLLPQIDYREAIEMTFYGAKVIHPKTIKPLMDSEIPLYVKSFENPDLNGTVVSSFKGLQYPMIKVLLSNQSLLQLSTRDFTFIFEDHLSEVFRLATKHKIHIQMMENLALNLSLVIESDKEHVKGFKEALESDFEIHQFDNLDLFTIRHYNQEMVDKIKSNRKVYIEEYNATTAQLVLGEIN